jgi:hypothetical protein
VEVEACRLNRADIGILRTTESAGIDCANTSNLLADAQHVTYLYVPLAVSTRM